MSEDRRAARAVTGFPAGRTARLVIRLLRIEDAPAFRDLTDDPAITGRIHFLSPPFTLADAQALIHGKGDGRDGFLGLWSPDSGDLLGVVGVHLQPAQDIEIGYWVRPDHHGRGLAGEALSWVIARLPSLYPGWPIFAECRDDNAPSRRVLEKAGFRTDGAAGYRPGRRRYGYDPEAPAAAVTGPAAEGQKPRS
ncbi:MAG: GNAT family N-acetyltransferase [Telmatospirillum sp.]|nr:GNAT family N-acetyltransferase [Telmatospirillum sp.]